MIKNLKIGSLLLLVALLVYSCSENQDGQWDDNIQLSTKTITMPATQSSYTVETNSTTYWLREIVLNDELADVTNIDLLAKNWVVETPDYRVERKEDGRKISIVMNNNTFGVERILFIGLQNGNYFDAIRVTQQK